MESLSGERLKHVADVDGSNRSCRIGRNTLTVTRDFCVGGETYSELGRIRMKEGNREKQNEQLAARNRQLGRG